MDDGREANRRVEIILEERQRELTPQKAAFALSGDDALFGPAGDETLDRPDAPSPGDPDVAGIGEPGVPEPTLAIEFEFDDAGFAPTDAQGGEDGAGALPIDNSPDFAGFDLSPDVFL